MPQLEISTYLTQIFWVLLTFICFWLVMDRFIIPGIAETIDARKRKYDDYLLKAERVNKKALASLRRYEETLAAAKAEAASQIKKNEDELKNMIAEREEDINRQLKEKIAESEAQLLKDKEAAMSKIEEISQAAAYAVIQKLGLETVTAEDIRNAHEELFYQSAEFWVAVAFVVIIALLFRPVTKVISGMIAKRIIRIRKELQEAENLKLQAQKLYAEYERKFMNTDTEVAEIVKEREAVIEETKEAKLRELNIFLQRKQNEVDSRIEQAFDQAGNEINAMVGARTAEILKSVISSKLTKSDYNRLIENSINNIKDVTLAE